MNLEDTNFSKEFIRFYNFKAKGVENALDCKAVIILVTIFILY